MKREYEITARGASHARREGGKLVMYRASPRPNSDDRKTIVLDDEQAKGPAFRHLGLRPVGPVAVAPVETPAKDDAGSAEGNLANDARALLDREGEMGAMEFRSEAGALLGVESFGSKAAAIEALEAVARPLD